MNNKKNVWREHWEKREDSGHRYTTLEWYQLSANEIMLFFPLGEITALEIGCGDGILFEFLKIKFKEYIGIDFSQSMLNIFKKRFPIIKLICADATEIPISNMKFDLVYSTGVCQYLDINMLIKNLKQVNKLLDTNGTYIIANIPDEQLRLHLFAGALRGDKDYDWNKAVKKWLVYKFTKQTDGLGYWYKRREFSKIAREHGFTCRTFSSSSLEYRFHAVLKKGIS